MARKALLVMVAGAAAVGIIVTGAAAGAALTDGPDDGFGVAVSSSPEGGFPPDGGLPSDAPTPSDGATTPPHDDDDDDDDDDSRPPASKAPVQDQITFERAVEIALGTTGGGTVVDSEREWEHGRPAWKIEIVKGGVEHDVYVDRKTGAIVKYDRNDDDDDHSGRGRGRHGHDD